MGAGMELLDHYPAPPGCCSFCRGDNLPVIDTGILEDDLLAALPEELRGHVFICAHCANEVAQLIGALPKLAADRQRERIREQNDELAELRDEVARWSALARSMADALPESEHEPVRAARQAALNRREALSGR
jgi:hypothetical protein